MNVIVRESAVQENAPLMSGVIENAAWTEARFIGSENVITIRGVVFVPDPRGAETTTNGRVVSTSVQVSFVGGAASTLPARSVASARNANVCASAPRANKIVVAVTPTAPG